MHWKNESNAPKQTSVFSCSQFLSYDCSHVCADRDVHFQWRVCLLGKHWHSSFLQGPLCTFPLPFRSPSFLLFPDISFFHSKICSSFWAAKQSGHECSTSSVTQLISNQTFYLCTCVCLEPHPVLVKSCLNDTHTWFHGAVPAGSRVHPDTQGLLAEEAQFGPWLCDCLARVGSYCWSSMALSHMQSDAVTIMMSYFLWHMIVTFSVLLL